MIDAAVADEAATLTAPAQLDAPEAEVDKEDEAADPEPVENSTAPVADPAQTAGDVGQNTLADQGIDELEQDPAAQSKHDQIENQQEPEPVEDN